MVSMIVVGVVCKSMFLHGCNSHGGGNCYPLLLLCVYRYMLKVVLCELYMYIVESLFS